MGSSKSVTAGLGRLEELESLVDELIKSRRQEEKIKSIMKKAGLNYSDDPIDQIQTVLKALEPSPRLKSPRRNPEVSM